MSRCPSEDWDSYAEREERLATGSYLNRIEERALMLLPGLLANPQHANLGTEDLVQLAFEVAAIVDEIRSSLESSGRSELGSWTSAFAKRWLP